VASELIAEMIDTGGKRYAGSITPVLHQQGRLCLKAQYSALSSRGIASSFELFNGRRYLAGEVNEWISKGTVRRRGGSVYQDVATGRVLAAGDEFGAYLFAKQTVTENLGDNALKRLLRSSDNLVEFGGSIAVDALIDLPFFYAEVVTNPYLTAEQRWLRGGIMAGEWIIGGVVGLHVGGVPGLVVGVAVGLGYEYILVPVLIRPATFLLTGIDPYDENMRLKPLE
jgi:hypothetical protein